MEPTPETAGSVMLPGVQMAQAAVGSELLYIHQGLKLTLSEGSCDHCRQRKVKCDRVEPICSACSRLELSCSFRGRADPTSANHQNSPDSVDQLTEAGIKRRRTRNACLQCRAQKARCSGSDPCERCQARGMRCELISSQNYFGTPGVQETIVPLEITENPDLTDCNTLLTDRSTTRKYIEAYFDQVNPMSCVFLHKPTILAGWSQSRLNPDMTILLCSLGVLLGGHSQKQRNAATAWAIKTQLKVLNHIGAQTIEQLQLLVLLLQFHFLAGTVGELWNLISLAARLIFTLQLNYERLEVNPVLQESQRRLVWAVYLLDRILSGGVEDLAVCPVERIHIRVPCDDHSFQRGVPSRAGYLNDQACNNAAGLDLLAYHIKLMAIRDRILRYVSRLVRNSPKRVNRAQREIGTPNVCGAIVLVLWPPKTNSRPLN